MFKDFVEKLFSKPTLNPYTSLQQTTPIVHSLLLNKILMFPEMGNSTLNNMVLQTWVFHCSKTIYI